MGWSCMGDGHFATAGGTQGLGSLTEPTCVSVGMVGGAPPLATIAKGGATTVGGAATQAGVGKVSCCSSLYAAEAIIWRGFHL